MVDNCRRAVMRKLLPAVRTCVHRTHETQPTTDKGRYDYECAARFRHCARWWVVVPGVARVSIGIASLVGVGSAGAASGSGEVLLLSL